MYEKSVKLIHWRIFSLFFLILLSTSFDVKAQEFYAASGPNIPSPSNNSIYRFGQIDDSRFFYAVTEAEDALLSSFVLGSTFTYAQTIYLYDVNTHTSTKLIELNFTNSDFSPELVKIPTIVRFMTSQSKSYIVASGHLLVTDGTPQGTRVLRDFGTRFCCQLGTQSRRIEPLVLDNGELYFTYDDVITSFTFTQQVDSISIWKTDGTVSGTQKVSPSFTDLNLLGPARNVFLNRNVDPNRAFYFSEGGIWKTDISNHNLFIALDDDRVEVFSKEEVITTSKGNFFCGLNDDKNDNALWRFSNSGKLTLIAERCDEVFAFGDRLFIRADGEIWESDGTNLGERLLFRYGERQHFNLSSCLIEDDIYFIFSDFSDSRGDAELFFQVSQAGNVLDRSDEIQSIEGHPVVSCLNENIVFNSHRVSKPPILFFPKNGKTAKVLNANNSIRFSGQQEDSLLMYRFIARPIFLSKTASPSLPSILMMLLDPVE